jgi:hypothetical protein
MPMPFASYFHTPSLRQEVSVKSGGCCSGVHALLDPNWLRWSLRLLPILPGYPQIGGSSVVGITAESRGYDPLSGTLGKYALGLDYW